MTAHDFKTGDHVWWNIGHYFEQSELFELPATVIDVGENDVTIRLRDNRYGDPGPRKTIPRDELRPHLEDEPPEPRYAVLTLVEPVGHPNEKHIRFAVLIVKQDDAPYIIRDLETGGASVRAAGENLPIDNAAEIAAEIHIVWEKKNHEAD
jgi:hypothetical protein